MSVSATQRSDQVKRIHDSFMLLMRVSKRWFVHRLQSFGLTLPQFVSLAALAAHQHPCTMGDLKSVTFQDPPTMTGVIDRLLKMRLVERTRSETDRRVVLVRATQAGIELVKKIENELMQDTTDNFEKLTSDELDTLEQLLKRLLHIHLRQYMSLQGVELDTETEKLELFMTDPITYTQKEQEKAGISGV